MSRATEQRHAAIVDELLDRKHVTVSQLSADMNVSEATIRRDLRALAEQNEVRLVHGGATVRRSADYSFSAKSSRQPNAKVVIGRLAAELVADGSQVFIDSGTTCFQMAPFLRRRERVLVLATSIRLAMELDVPDVEVILLGGHFRPARMDTVGPLAQSALDQLRGFTAFIGADGISQEVGPAASDMDSAHLHQLVVRRARQTYLLADSSKFIEPSLFRIAEWDQIDGVIMDGPPATEWAIFFEQRDIQVICANEEDDDA
jgi:DeoR family fructose operon transcriptional repressor